MDAEFNYRSFNLFLDALDAEGIEADRAGR